MSWQSIYSALAAKWEATALPAFDYGFSTDEDGWTITGDGTLLANQDAGGLTDTLKVTLEWDGSLLYADVKTPADFSIGESYTVAFDTYTVFGAMGSPSCQVFSGATLVGTLTLTDSGVDSHSITFTASATQLTLHFLSGGGTGDDAIYIGEVTVKQASLLPTAYPNADFSPPTGTPWARFFMLASPPSVGSLGDQGEDEVSGILQIDLHYPLGEGLFAINRVFDSIRASFKAGTYLTYGTQWVQVKSCGLDIKGPDGAFYTAFVTIEWETRLSRA